MNSISSPMLSIVIPCYNEVQNLPGLFDRIYLCVKQANFPLEFILVNNGSTDNSQEILNRYLTESPNLLLKIINISVNQGYGYGIWTGLQSAFGDYVGWTHADLQTDPVDIVLGFNKLLGSTDPEHSILCGRRIGRPLLDDVFTHGMSLVASLILKSRLTDINAQPKIFHHSFIEKIIDPPFDFSLDIYLLWLANREKLQIIEQPVNFASRVFGKAKGGGSFHGKIKLTIRTLKYIWILKKKLYS